MIPIAIALIVIVIVFSVAVMVGNPGGFTMQVFPGVIETSYAGLYLTGAAAMLVLVVAAGLLRIGVRRAKVKRRELAALRDAAADRDAASGTSIAAVDHDKTASGSTNSAGQRKAAGESSEPRAGTGATASGSAAAERSAALEPSGGRDGSGPAGSNASATGALSPSTPVSVGLASDDDDLSPLRRDEPVRLSEQERQALLEEAEETSGDEPRR